MSATSTGGTIDIPTDLKYVKGIIGCIRSATLYSVTNPHQQNALSGRAKTGMTQYQFSVNGMQIPSNSMVLLGTDAEEDPRGFMQVAKYFGNFPSYKASCSLPILTFTDTGIATTNHGGFCWDINCSTC